MATPKLNTLEKDIEDFQKERQKFLEDQERFKSGYATYGIVALNHLSSMYHILLASYHCTQKNTTIAPQVYLKAIQDCKLRIASFVKANQEAMPSDGFGVNFYQHAKFNDIERNFDDVVQNFYIIKSECGLT